MDCDVVSQKTSSCVHARWEDAFENDVAVPYRKVSMTMKCSTVALVLALVQLAAGVGLTALSIHTMLKLRSLTTRDCPLWAAAPLLSSGIVAIITVYSNSHYKSQSNRKPIFVLKAVSFALSSLSGILCFVAASFLVLHVLLYIDRYSDCHDQGQHCLCTMNDSRLYRYAGVNCAQVRGTVKALFYVTASVSAVGGLASVWLLALLWSSRYVYFQAGLRPPGPNEANRDAAADVYEQYSANPEPS